MSKAINLSGLKTLLEPLIHLIDKKAERPDWNENDPSSSSYIAGKTHWVETIEDFVVLNEYNCTNGNLPLKHEMIPGRVYRVIFDGAEYTCVATEYDGYVMVGNTAIYEYDNGVETDTGEPFAIEHVIGRTHASIYVRDDDEGAHSISIIADDPVVSEVIHKIDKKYLPEIELTGVAETGSYNDLVDKVAVEYVEQNLTDEQKEIARENIGAVDKESFEEELSSKVGVIELQVPKGVSLWNIFYCGDRFIAQFTTSSNSDYSSTGTIMYSLDGITWEYTEDIGLHTNVQNVCYGNGTYIIAGNRNIAYSTDFNTWTVVENALPSNINDICYGMNKFIATCRSNVGEPSIAYSSDGITWTPVTLPTVYDLANVCYGNGRFVAISYGHGFAYSDDGVSWVETSGIDDDYTCDICYSSHNGCFVVISYRSTSKCWYSTDGITWIRVSKLNGWNQCICEYGGRIVGVGNNVNYQYSNDGGKTWLNGHSDTATSRSNCCVGQVNNKALFIACGSFYQNIPCSSSSYAISYDGIHWSESVISLNKNDDTADVANLLSTQMINSSAFSFAIKEDINKHNISVSSHADIRTEVNALSTLVGETPVSEQISTAIDALRQEILGGAW